MSIVDIELLIRFRPPASDLKISSGCFTNWLGLQTDSAIFATNETINEKIFPDLPTGGDGVYGGYPEYASFLTAIEQTPSRKRFTAIELGAGWGPWISGIGVVCKRLGFERVDLVGVEADPHKCDLMRQHLSRNGLEGKVLQGAAWTEDTTLKFPIISQLDHGAAASVQASKKDYRGKEQEYIDVPAYSLKTICKDLGVIDYMHWDIQGAELSVAKSVVELLNSNVRFLFIGTHSRPIEGALIEFFYQNQWDILYQHPCHFVYDKSMPSIEGMTRTDGEIFARNPRHL